MWVNGQKVMILTIFMKVGFQKRELNKLNFKKFLGFSLILNLALDLNSK